MTIAPRPIPVRPAIEAPPVSLVHAAFALLSARTVKGRDADKIAPALVREMWPGDRAALALIERASVEPGSMTTTGWGEEIAPAIVGRFIEWLAPSSAIAALIPLGVPVTLAAEQSVTLSTRTTAPAAAAWVEELAGIPVRAGAFSAVTVGPVRKLGVIVPFSRELARRADAFATFAAMLRYEAAVSIDAAYFSATAASAAAHAGLLSGVSATTPAGDMSDDLEALARAVGAAGSGDVAFIAGPGLAASIRTRRPDLRAPVLASLAVAEDRVIAVDPSALVHAIGRDVDISAGEEMLIHMSTVPLEIVNDSGTTADPVRSMFQTATLAMRMLIDIAFAKQRSGAVAYSDAVSW